MTLFYFRNWCQYIVTKTVSCQVHNGTETTVQRVLQGCRWPGPCAKVIRYSQAPPSLNLLCLWHISWFGGHRRFCHVISIWSKLNRPYPYFCTSDILCIIAWSYNHMNQWLCAVSSSYRTVIRPSFMVTYKQVTVLEWKCCPGFVGEECREGELLNCSVFSRCKFLKHCRGECGYWN